MASAEGVIPFGVNSPAELLKIAMASYGRQVPLPEILETMIRKWTRRNVERQLGITKELSELLTQQLQALEDEAYLGLSEDSDDVSLQRSLRIRALRRELANVAESL
jgi:hypothetical protein